MGATVLAEHIGLHDETAMFVLALAALIIAVIVLVQTRGRAWVAWSAGLLGLALTITWWPS